jgi:hypothetical protein
VVDTGKALCDVDALGTGTAEALSIDRDFNEACCMNSKLRTDRFELKLQWLIGTAQSTR